MAKGTRHRRLKRATIVKLADWLRENRAAFEASGETYAAAAVMASKVLGEEISFQVLWSLAQECQLAWRVKNTTRPQ